MKEGTTFNVQAMNSVWKSFESNFGAVSTPLDKPMLDKYLGDLFCVGDFYYYVIDFSSFPDLRLSYIDQTAMDFHGLSKDEFTLQKVISAVHEEDMPFCSACEEVVMSFFHQLAKGELLNYKTSYTLRIKDQSGQYQYMQHQGIPIAVDEAGGMTHAINVHTNISHIKQESGGMMSLLGLNGRESFVGIDPFNPNFESGNPLTDREREVLDYLSRGFSSKDISKALDISPHTVDTHRRSMLKKLDSANTIELVQKAKTRLWF